jgi:hypothetical protein
MDSISYAKKSDSNGGLCQVCGERSGSRWNREYLDRNRIAILFSGGHTSSSTETYYEQCKFQRSACICKPCLHKKKRSKILVGLIITGILVASALIGKFVTGFNFQGDSEDPKVFLFIVILFFVAACTFIYAIKAMAEGDMGSANDLLDKLGKRWRKERACEVCGSHAAWEVVHNPHPDRELIDKVEQYRNKMDFVPDYFEPHLTGAYRCNQHTEGLSGPFSLIALGSKTQLPRKESVEYPYL